MTTKGEWEVYTGSDEQIAEIDDAKNGFICKNDYGYIWDDVYIDWSKCPIGATHYLICNPHPLADMICQWARTGQPVWFKDKETGKVTGPVTKGIDWDELDFYEYSFTPFVE